MTLTLTQTILLTLLLGVISSLAVTILWAVLGYLWTRQFRDSSIRVALRLLDAGVEFVYPNWDAAKKDIVTELKRADRIQILNIRGRSLVESSEFDFLLRRTPFRPVNVLLADPDAPSPHNPIEVRARELQKSEAGLSPAQHLSQAKSNLEAFYGYNRNQQCKLKVYQFPAVFRIFATESTMFLSFYPKHGGTRESKILRLPFGSSLFQMISKYFECTWDDPRSREPLRYKREPVEGTLPTGSGGQV